MATTSELKKRIVASAPDELKNIVVHSLNNASIDKIYIQNIQKSVVHILKNKDVVILCIPSYEETEFVGYMSLYASHDQQSKITEFYFSIKNNNSSPGELLRPEDIHTLVKKNEC